ncbi:MAG: hypothetical protein C0392_13140 [Syntrophus sp. (in: bacteria)]|nr:hypothetical protein [Syntrophus sp. (in: bacteria)]
MKYAIYILLSMTVFIGCASCGKEVKGLREEMKIIKEENSFLKAENIVLKKELDEVYKKLEERETARDAVKAGKEVKESEKLNAANKEEPKATEVEKKKPR